MKQKKKIIIGIIFLTFIILFTLGYYYNNLAFIGICKKGTMLEENGPRHKFCYAPSGHDGKPCDKKTDCGIGYCFLDDSNKSTKKGICHDLPFGCHVHIDKDGNLDEAGMKCTL